MLSIKDYARDSGVSYEAVRKQIKRYEGDLKGHIRIDGRTQYLDDVAVAFLNEHRSKNPLVVGDSITAQEKEQYKAEADLYRGLYEDELKKNSLLSQENSRLHKAQAQLEVADQKYALIEESRDEYKRRTERLQSTIDGLEEEKAKAVKAAEDLTKLKDHYADELKEQMRITADQNSKIGVLQDDLKTKDRLIEEFRMKAEAEAQKSKWQRFKEIWRTKE